jgi:phosphatidylinositol glycan class Q protein
MLMSDGLLRVFWPYDLPRSSSPGVIVGWRNSELDLFVLTVLEDVEVGGPKWELTRLEANGPD